MAQAALIGGEDEIGFANLAQAQAQHQIRVI